MKNDLIREYFADKDVVLLGNSVEVMTQEKGDWIESFDLVCRCGKGILIDDEFKPAIGSRTDVWFTGDLRSKIYGNKQRNAFKTTSLILYSRSKRNFDREEEMPDNIKESGIAYDMFTHEENKNWMKSFGSVSGEWDSVRPSMGLNAIKYLVEEVETYKSLTIYGFDFFVKYTKNPNPDPRYHLMLPKSWHMPLMAMQIHPHYHDKEIGYVQNWIDAGLLKWEIISDLSKEKISKTKFGKF